jgi:hypothetical protein
MPSYELRFLSSPVRTSLVYHLICEDDASALSKVPTVTGLPYHSYEVWREDVRVGAGKYLSVGVGKGVSARPPASKEHMAFWAKLNGHGWREKELKTGP